MAELDFGTIIYLVIIILATVFGGRKKKKTSSQDIPIKSSRKSGRSFLDELLKELQVQPETVTSPEQPSRQHPYAPQQKVTSSQNEFYKDSVESNYPVFPILDKVEEDYFEKKRDYFESNKVSMNFDAIMEGGVNTALLGSTPPLMYKKAKPKFKLKEAFVYSEILNRKQW